MTSVHVLRYLVAIRHKDCIGRLRSCVTIHAFLYDSMTINFYVYTPGWVNSLFFTRSLYGARKWHQCNTQFSRVQGYACVIFLIRVKKSARACRQMTQCSTEVTPMLHDPLARVLFFTRMRECTDFGECMHANTPCVEGRRACMSKTCQIPRIFLWP